jgi:hypothetical protein
MCEECLSDPLATVRPLMALRHDNDANPGFLTDAVGGAYIATLMANAGGVDAAKLTADAIAAQQGDQAAKHRLLTVFRPPRAPRPRRLNRRRPVLARRRPAARPRRRAATCRARAPGRPSPPADLDEPPQRLAVNTGEGL